MSDCTEFEESIDRVQAGDGDRAERERLLDHLDVCAGCSELFDLVGQLSLADSAPEPSEVDLGRMRSAVLAGLRSVPTRRPRPVRLLRPLLAAAAGLAVLAIGFALGSVSGSAMPEEDETTATPEEQLARQLRLAATGHSTIEERDDSPYLLTNVRAQALPGGQVRLALDVGRHLDLVVDRDDPLLAEALVQTLVGSTEAGARLAAIELTSGRLNERVKRALLMAMLEDENLGVRLEALARLATVGADDEITDAMLEVLERDEAVQMRLMAIDYLTENRVRPERLEQALSGDHPAMERALYVRAGSYLGQSG